MNFAGLGGGLGGGHAGGFDGGSNQTGLVGAQPNLNDENDSDDDENSAVAYRSIKNKFPEFDKNGDGRITIEDFVLAARRKNLGSDGEMVFRNAFRQIDKNGNGVLEKREVRKAYNLIQNLLN